MEKSRFDFLNSVPLVEPLFRSPPPHWEQRARHLIVGHMNQIRFYLRDQGIDPHNLNREYGGQIVEISDMIDYHEACRSITVQFGRTRFTNNYSHLKFPMHTLHLLPRCRELVGYEVINRVMDHFYHLAIASHIEHGSTVNVRTGFPAILEGGYGNGGRAAIPYLVVDLKRERYRDLMRITERDRKADFYFGVTG